MSPGFAMMVHHLAKLQQGARLLALDAIMHAEEGNAEDAGRSVAAGLATGRSLDEEPICTSQLVRITCDAITLDALSHVLSRIALPPTMFEDLSGALRKSEDPEGMNRGFAGELCAGLRVFGAYQARPFSANRPITSTVWDADQREFLNFMRKALDATKLPPERRIAASRSMQSEANSLPNYCLVCALICPAMTHYMESDLHNVAVLRAARTALAVERYRQTDGKLPDKLDDLCPDLLDAVPADPFDGAPLRYKKLEKGYIVYSVGPDGKDDGGAEKDPKARPFGQPQPEDVVFRVAR
jgi:hypothetical protein